MRPVVSETEIILGRNEDSRLNYKTKTRYKTEITISKFTSMQSYNRDKTNDK